MSAGSTPPSTGGGIVSTLKIGVIVAVLVGIVFGLTLITMYKPKDLKDDDPGQGTANVSGEPPLRIFSIYRRWDPPNLRFQSPKQPHLVDPYLNLPLLAPSAAAPEAHDELSFNFALQNRVFQGFYEPSNSELEYRRAQFWFENRNPSPVTMELQEVNCVACTGGKVAAIPPAVMKQLFQHTALSTLPVGPFNAYGVGLWQPAVHFSQLEWSAHEFKSNPHAQFTVPAMNNPDGWSPQWGILELNFRVTARKEPLFAKFITRVDGTQQSATVDFGILFDVAEPCAVSTTEIDAGVFEQGAGARVRELLVYSTTRGPGSEYSDLDVPQFITSDKFVTVKPDQIKRVPEEELRDLEPQVGKRVRAAYRVPITIRPQVDQERMDIGQFEKHLSLTTGGVTKQIKIRGQVRGAVWLENRQHSISLGTFKGNEGLVHQLNLATERPDTVLEVVASECAPPDCRFELERLDPAGGQGRYRLKITIPPGKVGSFVGEAVLEIKGENAQRIRIPISGAGRL